jgi:para-aminobenzoate synthetase component I
MFDAMNAFGRGRVPFLFIIDFDMKRTVVMPLGEAAGGDVLYSINGRSNSAVRAPDSARLRITKSPVEYGEYLGAFERVRAHLLDGDSYLVNLTFETRVDLPAGLRDIYLMSRAPYRLLFRDEFVVFSPEPFVRIENGSISSFPMKGTIDASLPDAEGRVLADEKEFAEHVTIVDLIRNDLSIVARNVRVPRFRYVERVHTHSVDLLQVSSEVRGELDGDWHGRLGDILAALLPAGSVTGAPKRKTVEIIREVESHDRGWYTGVMGCYDGNSLESAVMIRFIGKRDGVLYYKSGGGITADSDPRLEYQKMLDKIYVPVD